MPRHYLFRSVNEAERRYRGHLRIVAARGCHVGSVNIHSSLYYTRQPRGGCRNHITRQLEFDPIPEEFRKFADRV